MDTYKTFVELVSVEQVRKDEGGTSDQLQNGLLTRMLDDCDLSLSGPSGTELRLFRYFTTTLSQIT